MALALVLGARGFIGRAIAAAMRDDGWQVVGSSREPFLEAGRGDWVVADLLRDPADRLTALMADLGVTVVVNAVGVIDGTPDQLRAGNVATLSRLVEAVGISPLRPLLIQIGSAAEYGLSPVGVPVSESAIARPRGAYGVSKLEATRLVSAAVEAGRLDGLVLRVFNALGPGMRPTTLPAAAAGRIREAIAAGSDRVEMGPLDAVRDFVDARDVGRAAALAAGAPSRPGLRASASGGAVVNIGSGVGHPARAVVEALAAEMGFRGAIEQQPLGHGRSDDVPWQVADIRLAARRLGWHPRRDLSDAVRYLLEG